MASSAPDFSRCKPTKSAVVMTSSAAQSHHSQRAMSETALSGSSRRNALVIDSSRISACTISRSMACAACGSACTDAISGSNERGCVRATIAAAPSAASDGGGVCVVASARNRSRHNGRHSGAGTRVRPSSVSRRGVRRAPAACSARAARDNRAAHSPGSRRAISAIAAKARCARVSSSPCSAQIAA